MKLQMELYLKSYTEYINKTADELRNTNMPKLTEALFSLYEDTGNRIKYEKVYFARRKFLNVFAMNSILYHRKEDIEKLEEIIRDICNEECWALPAHVDRKNNKNWKITIELFASETAQALTEISVLLNTKLNDEIKKLIDENVTRRLLKPFYDSKPPYDNWEFCEMNWCAVCAGCIGSISIIRFKDNTELLERCLSRINEALTYYIKGFTKDGVCAEGLDYWTYGMSYYVMYARDLKAYTNGNVDLLDSNKMKNIMTFQQKCYFNDGTSISFSDGCLQSRFRMGLTSYLADNYDDVHFPDIKKVMQFDEDECYRWAPAYRDYAWTKEYLEKLIDENDISEPIAESSTYVFDSAQWFICNGKNSSMAAKGGNNDEPHNHNDIGNFVYVYGGIEYLVDLGAGEYCKNYFNDNRYKIFCNTTESHNVPIINNKQQLHGEKYCCTYFETDGAKSVIMKIGEAYEKGCIDDIERKINFEGDQGELYVRDTFILSDKTECIEENLVTKQTVSIKDNIITLTENDAKCKIIIDDPKVQVEVLVKEHFNHAGIKEKITILRWTVCLEESRQLNKSSVTCTFKIIPDSLFVQ
ncbi:heparinase II/III family protein [[Clostridium] fimetarium]|uniref:Heparinase II/III-like protein n=1 Tax=[Clostridium] fimetarium TaxID=99656 RepID=A0A1I0NMY4_9FIRM|nr:heparinase II/III family protein [[Clostridium] fimetarium]SEW02687.1 Heparinase II/III-like protein [[Clostridium] fimetarium]